MHTANLNTNTDACMADLKSVAKQVQPKDTFACLYHVHVRHTMNLTCAPYCTDYEMYLHQYKYGTHIHMYKDMSLNARCGRMAGVKACCFIPYLYQQFFSLSVL